MSGVILAEGWRVGEQRNVKIVKVRLKILFIHSRNSLCDVKGPFSGSACWKETQMRCALAVVGCLALLATTGCSMCASPYDCSYAAYGGRIQRVDRVHGRVGSILDPSAGQLGAAPGTSMLVPASTDEQVFGEPSPMEPQAWDSIQAEGDWPSPQQPADVIPWQPDREMPSGTWTEEPSPEPADPGTAALPQSPQLNGDAGDF